MGRPAIKITGGLQLVCGRATLALSSALVPQTLSCLVCVALWFDTELLVCVESLLAETNEPSLYNRRLKLSMQYALKFKCNPSNPKYETVFEPQYKTLLENKPNMIPSFGIKISSELENMNLDFFSTTLQTSKSQMFHPGLFLSLVFYFHCTMTRSFKLILLFFELNFMSCCLNFQTMRLYLQMVQKMVTQLDQPVLLHQI